AAPHSLKQAQPSSDYVPSPEHPPLLDYIPGLEYPEYLVPSDDEVPIKDQPLPVDASHIALSPGYVTHSNPLEEDPEEDPADYLADGGDDDKEEEESFEADDDEEEASEEDKDEEEDHLAPADSTALPAIDPVPLAEDTKPFETDESAGTPPPPPISPRTKIPSPPLPVLSPPLPLSSSPTHTSPTYADALLGYKAAMIQSRATSPPLVPSPPLFLPYSDRRNDILETDMPFRKRLCLTVPASRFKVRESSTVAAARQTRHTLAHRVDYRFVDIVDASI
ncbi:hypothetical protein Tco_1307617, partial [Tanacetum coccineum]